jgi:glycine/D-amino acid oxidase-like deaminating enzyme
MRADVVIAGAGICGVSAAHELACRRGVGGVVLVDPGPPLSLTSDKSTECYRNWWPGPGDGMVRLMNRSIDLLAELAAETGDAFALHPAGYAYFTGTAEGARRLEAEAREIAALGAGELHVHGGGGGTPALPEAAPRGSAGPSRADLLLAPAAIAARFPCLTERVAAALLVGRAGWLSGQQLGMVLLERARAAGVRLLRDRVSGVRVEGGRVVAVELASGTVIAAGCLVDAAGPLAPAVARLVGVELPLHHELHAKLTFDDHLRVVPRDLPLMIWNDPIRLDWGAAERAELATDPELAWLLDELPGGAHLRPEGGPESTRVLMLWAYHTPPLAEPTFPLAHDPLYPQVVLRGLARMLPGLAAYAERGRRPFVDGGYYTRTPENRPLVGPLGPDGAYLIGAVSGFGLMVAQGAAELLADHVTGATPPPYAGAFRLERYEDPAYRRLLEAAGGGRGQL